MKHRGYIILTIIWLVVSDIFFRSTAFAQRTPTCKEAEASENLKMALEKWVDIRLGDIAFRQQTTKMGVVRIDVFSSEMVSGTDAVTSCVVSFYATVTTPDGGSRKIPLNAAIVAAYDKDGELKTEVITAQ